MIFLLEEETRRRSTRYPLRLPVTLVVRGELIDGVSRNVSTGGMYVELGRAPEDGSWSCMVDEGVTMSVVLPGQSMEMIMEAQIRWDNGSNGIGLRFHSLARWKAEVLERVVTGQADVGLGVVAAAERLPAGMN